MFIYKKRIILFVKSVYMFQGYNLYRLKYISLEQVKVYLFQQLGRQCMYFSNEFVILIFQLIYTCIYLTMLFYLLHYMVVRNRALKIAKLLKIYTMIP